MLHLPTDFTGGELHGVNVRIGGVGANSREKRVEITSRYVLRGHGPDARSSYDPAYSAVTARAVWAGWRSNGAVTEVRAQEGVDAAGDVHLAEMQVCLGDVGC